MKMKMFSVLWPTTFLCLTSLSHAQNADMPGLRSVPVRPSRARMTASSFFNEPREFDRPHAVSVPSAAISFPVLQPDRGDPFNRGPIPVAPVPTIDNFDGPLEETGEPPVLELPEDMDISHMKVGLRERDALNSLRSPEDFLKLFNLEKPKEASDADGIFARFGGGPSMDTVNAVCSPENKTVRLDLPRELNVVFFPTCVRLMRCGGCCHGPLLSCQPTQRSAVTLKILKVGSSSSETRTRNAPEGASRARNRTPTRSRTRTTRNRSRREETTTYVDVQEYHDTECKCMCRIKPEHCDPLIHNYDVDDCQCRCKNTDEQDKCEAKSSTHYWDNKSCNCYCLKEETCSTGQRFDHTSCSCVKFSGFLRRGFSGRAAGDSLDLAEDEVAEEPAALGPIVFGNGK